MRTLVLLLQMKLAFFWGGWICSFDGWLVVDDVDRRPCHWLCWLRIEVVYEWGLASNSSRIPGARLCAPHCISKVSKCDLHAIARKLFNLRRYVVCCCLVGCFVFRDNLITMKQKERKNWMGRESEKWDSNYQITKKIVSNINVYLARSSMRYLYLYFRRTRSQQWIWISKNFFSELARSKQRKKNLNWIKIWDVM